MPRYVIMRFCHTKHILSVGLVYNQSDYKFLKNFAMADKSADRRPRTNM